jgi:hypothetical protein
MVSNTVERYDEWNLELPPLSPRSRLYTLEPIGVGTPFVESLTSYLVRLAEAHCVFPGTLLQKVLVPQMAVLFPQKSSNALLNAIGDSAHAINAAGPHAQRMVAALEALTCRRDLRSLTLLLWANVLFGKGAIRPKKAWCPACYEAWQRCGHPVYDPLL